MASFFDGCDPGVLDALRRQGERQGLTPKPVTDATQIDVGPAAEAAHWRDMHEASERKLAEAEAASASAQVCCDNYATENQQFHDRFTAAERRLAEAVEVVRALLHLADEIAKVIKPLANDPSIPRARAFLQQHSQEPRT